MDVLAERSRVLALDSVVTCTNTRADKFLFLFFSIFFLQKSDFLDWLIQNSFHIRDPKKFLDTNWIFVFSLIRMLTDSNWFSHFHTRLGWQRLLLRAFFPYFYHHLLLKSNGIGHTPELRMSLLLFLHLSIFKQTFCLKKFSRDWLHRQKIFHCASALTAEHLHASH